MRLNHFWVEGLFLQRQMAPNYCYCYHEENSTAFFRMNGSLEVVEILLSDLRVDVNKSGKYGYTPLHLASMFGHAKVVEILLSDPRVDVNKPGKNGCTPLHMARVYGSLEVVEILLSDPRVLTS